MVRQDSVKCSPSGITNTPAFLITIGPTMNLSSSLRTLFRVSLLGCCHLCVGFPTEWWGSVVDADDGSARDSSAGSESAMCCVFCLLALVFAIITLSSTRTVDPATACDTTKQEETEPNATAEVDLQDPVDAKNHDRQRNVRNSEVREKWTRREGWSAFKPGNQSRDLDTNMKTTVPDITEPATDRVDSYAPPNNDQDILLAAIHQLTTLHSDDCGDILLCAEEPIWDDTMDEALCDVLSCAMESIQNSFSIQAVESGEGEQSTAHEDEKMVEVSAVKEKRRDVTLPFELRDPVCKGVPAMRPIDSEVSFSSNSLSSTSSVGSYSLASPTRTRKMSPQPNAEWAIME